MYEYYKIQLQLLSWGYGMFSSTLKTLSLFDYNEYMNIAKNINTKI